MANGTIVRKNKGFLIPIPFLERLEKLKYNVTGMSLVVQENGKNQLIPSRVPQAMPIADFNDVQTKFKGHDIDFFFGHYASGHLEEDLQPFTLLGDAKSPLILGMFEGEFNNFERTESSHIPAFFAVNEYLYPTIKNLYEQKGSDLTKLVAELKGSLFKQTMGLVPLARGVITLYCSTGDRLTFEKGNDKCLRTEWGWSSQSHGYKEESYPAKEAEPEKPKNALLSGLGGLIRGNKPPAVAPPPAPDKEIPIPATETAIPDSVKEGTKPLDNASVLIPKKAGMIRPPDNVPKSDWKKWYKTNGVNGHCPKDYHQRPWVEAKNPETLARFTAQPTAIAAALEQATVKSGSVPSVKTLDPLVADEDSLNHETAPMIPADQKKLIQDQFLKNSYLTKSPDLLKLQEEERKLPSFTDEIVGLNGLEDCAHWSFLPLRDLAHASPEGAAKLIMEYRDALDSAMADLEKLTAPGAKQPISSPPAKPVVQAPAAAAVAPAAKGGGLAGLLRKTA